MVKKALNLPAPEQGLVVNTGVWEKESLRIQAVQLSIINDNNETVRPSVPGSSRMSHPAFGQHRSDGRSDELHSLSKRQRSESRKRSIVNEDQLLQAENVVMDDEDGDIFSGGQMLNESKASENETNESREQLGCKIAAHCLGSNLSSEDLSSHLASCIQLNTANRTYAAVCGGGLTALTYSQPAVMAAASWNPYSMWGPPSPWYTTAYPGLGQQQAPMQAPPPPSAELLAALAATTPIGAAEAATTPIGAAKAATTPIGAAEAATTPIGAAEAATTPIGAAEAATTPIGAAEAATTPIGATEAGPSQASSDDVKIIEESDETNFIEATPPTRELVKRSPSSKWTKVEKKKKKMSVKLFSSSESEGDSSAVPLLAATSSRPTTAQATSSSRPTTAQGSRTTQGRGSASMTAPSNSCAPSPTSSSKLFNISRFNFVNETT
ncbi:endochitinase A1-like [Nilaparvata lugens]|uniref:endochitinase A1-like n=1 Tax=Nilaparvata lugens TaxID=108931 RepID=UPI00193DD645|nr:endochitinase A1-like [Nilaparvata lugens]